MTGPARQPNILKRLRSESGVTVVFLALMLTVLLAVVGLAIDGSNAYAQQQRMQTAADAAVLAGARLLALGQPADVARAEAQTLATANGAHNLNVAVVQNDRVVEATATRNVETYFARIVGVDTIPVRASAQAGYVVVGRIGGLFPITTMCPAGGFVYGQVYELRDRVLDGPGNFGWLSWTGSNSGPTLVQNIENQANSPVIQVGDWIETTTGVTYGSSVRSALDDALGRVFTIPLYDLVTGGGDNFRYRICGFAQFELLGHTNNTVTGRFVRNLISGEPVEGGADVGSRDIRMLE